jgi:hypothetical protein
MGSMVVKNHLMVVKNKSSKKGEKKPIWWGEGMVLRRK